jgi:hypothetical protein
MKLDQNITAIPTKIIFISLVIWLNDSKFQSYSSFGLTVFFSWDGENGSE